jgi:hypothetical protein
VTIGALLLVPGWNDDPPATLQRARDDPAYQQLYLRYFGGVS